MYKPWFYGSLSHSGGDVGAWTLYGGGWGLQQSGSPLALVWIGNIFAVWRRATGGHALSYGGPYSPSATSWAGGYYQCVFFIKQTLGPLLHLSWCPTVQRRFLNWSKVRLGAAACGECTAWGSRGLSRFKPPHKGEVVEVASKEGAPKGRNRGQSQQFVLKCMGQGQVPPT